MEQYLSTRDRGFEYQQILDGYGITPYYYDMIDTPNDRPSDLKYTPKCLMVGRKNNQEKEPHQQLRVDAFHLS